MKKRILAMLLVLAMALCLAPMAMAEDVECSWGEDCPSKGFTDLPQDAWFHEAIDIMIASGVMNGVSADEFDPAGGMTRAMYVTVLYRAFGDDGDYQADFTDVEKGSWYEKGVAWAQTKGIVNGMGNGKFAPHDILTREQMVVINYRYTIAEGGYIPKKEADLSAFKDAASVSDWAKEAMAWAVGEGMIKGDGNGYLNPVSNATRSEGACALLQYVEVPVYYPDEIVETEEDFVAAVEKGGVVLVEKDVELDDDTVINVTKDVEIVLYADMDLSNNSRPFSVGEGVYFCIEGNDQTVTMGKYGLVNIPGGEGVYIVLNGGNYEGKTDYGSFIKPRGTGEMSIELYDVNVTDESDNGSFLIDATSHSGNLSVYVYGGTYKSYNGITSAEYIDIDGADMTFVADGILSWKEAYVNNCTIKVTKENTDKEQAQAPSAAIIAYSNGYINVTNSTLDCAGDAMAVYTSGGTIEAEAVTIVNGTISEYHPRNHYPDAEFLVTVDGKVPADLLFPNCEGKTPCADCTTFVADEDELRAAITAGGKIALIDDIKMDADATITVASGKKVDLNLNKNTIAGVSDVAGNTNREMFLVKGEMNVYNGTITADHTGDEMEWKAMTTIFDVTGGGVLNVKDALLENLGGTAMTFAVHLNNWGEVTLNAENTTFKAPYTAVRVFNSGYDMNNVSFKECVLHGDNRAFWVHNYIGDLNSTQHPDDAINARLNIDLINGTNEITNGTPENPKNNPIRYGFGAAAIYYDALGNDVTIR